MHLKSQVSFYKSAFSTALFLLFFLPTLFNISDTSAQCIVNTAVTGNMIISSNTSLSGVFNVTDTFRVEAGVTLTVVPFSVNGCGEIEINARVIEILGTINANGAGYTGGTGGAAGGCWAADGSTDCRGIVSCWDSGNCRQLRTNGGGAGSAGNGPGAGAPGTGGANTNGNKQVCNTFDDDSGRVGGAGGAGGGNGACYGGTGGNSGAGGNGSTTNGCSGNATCSTTGGAGGAGGAVNSTACTAYGNANAYNIEIGSGGAGAGGGGRGKNAATAGGSGGIGGGVVKLIATGNLNVTGSITANGTTGGNGGNGGSAGDNGSRCCSDITSGCDERTYTGAGGGGSGAGGGSGGGILLDSKCGDMTLTGIIQAKGGNGGAGGQGGAANTGNGSSSAGGSGAAGGAGGGGRVKFFKNACGSNTVTSQADVSAGTGNGNATAGTLFNGMNTTSIVAGSIGSNQTICAGTAPVTIASNTDASMSTCNASFTYQWQSANAATGPWSNIVGATANSYAPGIISSNSYFRRTVLSGQCVDTIATGNPVEIFMYMSASTATVTNASCNGASDGSALAVPVGGVAPYSYLWLASNNTNALETGLSAGAYQVKITDATLCEFTLSVNVSEPVVLAASISAVTNVLCNGGTTGQATVSAAGGNSGFTYLWSDSNASATASVTGLMANIAYDVTVTDSRNCTATTTVTLTEPAALAANATVLTDVNCGGGNDGSATSAPAGGTAPYSYLWDNTNASTLASISALTAGVYNVTVTDANTCTTTSSVTIATLNTAPVATITPAGSTALCAGDLVLINGSPAGNYIWSDGSTSQSIVTTQAGNYSFTVTDGAGCSAASATIVVTVSPLPPVPVINTIGFDLQSSTAGGYQWYLNNNIIIGATTQIYTPNQIGDYTVVITDANGCTEVSAIETVLFVNIDEANMQQIFSVFPNPANSSLNIAISLVEQENISVTLFNSMGQIIYETMLNNAIGNVKTKIDMEHLPAGIYLLNLKGNKTSISEKVMKQE